MSCDGWSAKNSAIVSKNFDPFVVRNFRAGITRESVQFGNTVEFRARLNVTVEAIFNEKLNHEMIVSYPLAKGGRGYALLSHKQMHLLRRS